MKLILALLDTLFAPLFKPRMQLQPIPVRSRRR